MPKTQAEVFSHLVNNAEIFDNDAFQQFISSSDFEQSFTINDTSETDADAGNDPFEDPVTYAFTDGSKAQVSRKPDESDDGDNQDQPLIATVVEETVD